MGPKSKTSIMGLGITLISVGSTMPADTGTNGLIKAVMILAGVILIFIKYRATEQGINLEGGSEDANKGTNL